MRESWDKEKHVVIHSQASREVADSDIRFGPRKLVFSTEDDSSNRGAVPIVAPTRSVSSWRDVAHPMGRAA